MNKRREKTILRALRIIFSHVSFIFWKNWEFLFFEIYRPLGPRISKMCEKYCCDQPSVSPLAVFVVNPISHGVLWSQKCWAFIPKLFVTTISLWCVNFSGTKARKKISKNYATHNFSFFLKLLGNWPEEKKYLTI